MPPRTTCLTGPDLSGDYSVERTVDLTEILINSLGLEKLSMGGTSLGGTVAIHYAARHPERIDKLILLSPGSIEGRNLTQNNRVGNGANILKYILPRSIPEFMLRSGFGDPGKLKFFNSSKRISSLSWTLAFSIKLIC